MTLVDVSSLIDPSAEDLASQGLAEQAQPPPYAASPFPTRSLFNHGGLTWNPVTTAENAAAAAAALTESEMSEEAETTSVVHHLQTDSVNTDCDLLFEMAGGMTMSPPRPRMNFSGEEALFLTLDLHTDMGGGMMMSISPSRMNYFSPPSGDFIENSDPFRLWNFADHSEAQELENRMGMMVRQQQQPCIEEVDAGSASASALGQNQRLGIWAEALEEEAENMGGTVLQSGWGTHPQPQPQRSDDHSVNNVGEWFQLAGGMMRSLPKMMNYSLPSHDSHPIGLGGCFDPYRFWDNAAYSVGYELHNREKIMHMMLSCNAVDSELFSHKEFWLNIAAHAMGNGWPLAHADVNLFWKCKYTTFSLIEVEVGIRGASIEQKSVTIHPPSCGQCGVHNSAVFEFLEKEFGDTSNSVQALIAELQHRISLKDQLIYKLWTPAAELAKSVTLERHAAELEKGGSLERLAAELAEFYTVHIFPALLKAACRMRQLDSPYEGHIPKSSATNEETNNVVELNNSIHAKGGNTSSHKTDRWEKDHGITRQLLQQLFGKSRDDAAKTLKVSTSTLKRACRHFGINRWPNHSKGKMPKCTLNQKQHVQAVRKHKGIEPCRALPPLQASDTSQCNSTVSVKVIYKNDTLRFPLSSSSTIKYLEEQLETKLKISLENFCIKYQDEEDEWITLTCDSELLHGLDLLRSCGKTVIRMMVTPKFN